ncbi:exodeoxyribonuclease V subunit gamma [Ramlibacter sp.]|uniref:exodeoxyribonuclease V subunit gamma n=1 Tax=Ramlibacter sp. TaxID=1917967 RepID=UPI003D0B67B2
MLHLHFSNRYESLAEQLFARLAGPRANVFEPDAVLVPSAAIRRALTLGIADREGVCANIDFLFLARWLWTQVARVVPGVQAESPFDPEALAWRVYDILRDPAFVSAHPRLAAYLAEADEVMRFDLATRAAGLLEQYVTYRTDWLETWQAGALAGIDSPDEAWQAALWHRIAAELGLGTTHPIAAMAQRLAEGGEALARDAGLPGCVHVFAPSAMPPLHLHALQVLGRCMDVHLYVQSPCREFWHDIVDERRLSRLEAQGRADAHEVGHRLLAAWGGQSQSHLALLADAGAGANEDERYVQSGSDSLLARLQDGILDLREFEPASVVLADDDRSVQIHAAHSLTRELEVLHDCLLGRFAADASLRPSDVLVVTPDLERAAPLVEAVFGTASGPRHIPFAITGRARSEVDAPVRAFLELLSIASSRCTATQVHGLLQQPVVARRFGLDAEALQRIHGWIAGAGIHWALDAEHVDGFALPRHASHTFEDGLDRLFLGYALPTEVDVPFDGTLLPQGDAEGSSALALGAFRQFVDRLRALRDGLSQPRGAVAWGAFLHEAADDFLEPDDDELEDHVELHAAFDAVAQAMVRGGVDGAVGATVVRAALKSALDVAAMGGVPTGRVTFTSMTSLRNLPFRIVCALGMNDGAFPTPDRPPEFDLMAHRPRLGDRQRRIDQRTLFLDLLLAARDCFYLSYTGRSIRDNAPLPPSVMVSELLDVLLPAMAGDAREARARLVTAHPLQPFRPAPRAVEAQVQVQVQPAPEIEEGEGEEEVFEPSLAFFAAPLAPPGPEWREVSLDTLIRFFRNPSRYLLKERLGVELPREEDTLDDDEPFLPTVPARSALAQRLLPLLLAGAQADAVRPLARAGTELPVGALGDADRESEVTSLAEFAREVREACGGPAMAPVNSTIAIEVDGEAWRVHASWPDLRPTGLVRWRYDKEHARDVLQSWLRHLALCASGLEGVAPCTLWIGLGGRREFAPRSAAYATQALAELLRLYRDGLVAPLPFFPKASWAYVSNDGSASKARQAWIGSPQFGGESRDVAYRLAFRGVQDPLDAAFERVADAVFAPIFAEAAP